MTSKRFRRDAGVTLVEMMVVIVIIGLITAIVVVNVLPAQDTARLQKARADIRMLEQALELYRLDRARYPSTEEGLDALVTPPAGDAAARAEPYIRALPNDPWGKPYVYVSPGAEREFDLFSYGADGQQGGEGRNADVGPAQ
ncbi:MAG: type II secretion system major pseudopilin GspG [Hyphomonadaceae bacterium]|nr:type II secretion system major pseudopilin GspG [Hyphomonadaceae bacterium]